MRIAEAYRLAELVHVEHTFEDLDTTTGGDESGARNADSTMELGLEIIKILENIPISSGSRCIQPLLCLTAGIVLRADVAATPPDAASVAALNEAWSSDLRAPSPSPSGTLGPHDLEGGDGSRRVDTCAVSERSVRIVTARRFILQRFAVLESSLPPRPIRVAKQLVQTVWAAYDSDEQASVAATQVHLIDIMVKYNLRTVFG